MITMITSFFFLLLSLHSATCENDYHNLLHRYHELMNEELLDGSVSSPLQREEKEESGSVPDRSTFHSHPSQSQSGLDGGDMRLPHGLLVRLISEGERRKSMRQSNGELRQ